MKKNCAKFKNWLEKKGNYFTFVCYESNMTSINHNTWWIDYGSTIHVFITIEGMQNLGRSIGNENCIYLGSKMSSMWRPLGHEIWFLSSGFILSLEKYVMFLILEKT